MWPICAISIQMRKVEEVMNFQMQKKKNEDIKRKKKSFSEIGPAFVCEYVWREWRFLSRSGSLGQS